MFNIYGICAVFVLYKEYIGMKCLCKIKSGYIFPDSHCHENITNSHVSAYCHKSLGASMIYTNIKWLGSL